MIPKNQKRNRGVILTEKGLIRLKDAINNLAKKENYCELYTLEQLAEITTLSSVTIRKVLNQSKPVDRRSLSILFYKFQLPLNDSDYIQTDYCSIFSSVKKTQKLSLQINPDVSNISCTPQDFNILSQWILKDNCRLILLFGMGGVGKSSLVSLTLNEIQQEFDCIIWRSLDNRLLMPDIVNDWGGFLFGEPRDNYSIVKIIEYLQQHKCCLIIDDLENILESNSHQAKYLETHKNYAKLFKILGTTSHQSSLILISREKPRDIIFLEDEHRKIRSLHLHACPLVAADIIEQKKLKGSIESKQFLCNYYGNNYVLINFISLHIRLFFNGDITLFLSQQTRVIEKINDFIFEHYERISPSEQKILMNSIKSLNNLGDFINNFQINNGSNIELLLALRSLIGRSLIIQKDENFRIDPIIEEYVNRQI